MHGFLRTLLPSALWTLALCVGIPAFVHAQSGMPSESPDQIAQEIQSLHPKTVVLVFDVTQSTRTGGVFSQERSASATIIRQGCTVGDRVVLEKFGTGYTTVFDQTLTAPGDAQTLIDQLPPSVEPGHGTNIRWPHHEALKLIQDETPKPGVIVLLTDSFNDRPDETDPNTPKYRAYYKLSSLTSYPDTPENQDYERLLRRLKASGNLHQYGVGVGIAPSGRPIERLPVGPGQGDAGTATPDLKPIVLPSTETQKPGSNLPLILGGAAVVLAVLLAALFAGLNRPVPIRLALTGAGRTPPTDFKLRPGAKIGLGGTVLAAAPGDSAFPLAGLPAPIAFVQAVRGGANLVPVPPQDPASSSPRVLHNGIPLEASQPLRLEDEIRILIPATDTQPLREHRVRFANPHSEQF